MNQLPPGFVDGRSVPVGSQFEADVCIVGAGPVGVSLAEDLVGRGLSVCLVESGGIENDKAVNELNHGERAGDGTVDPYVIRRRQFGGLSNVWGILFDRPRAGVRYVPFDAIDFEAREEVPHSGWPMTYTEMTSWYERAHAYCELGKYDYSDPAAAIAEAASPGIGFTSPDGDLKTSLFQFGPSNRYFEKSKHALSKSGRAQVLLHTSALELEVTEDERHVVGLTAGSLDGSRMRVRARCYVLSGGTIENARLMLLSTSRNPAGVGNRNDMVGRYLMDHPQDKSSYLVPASKSVFDRLTMHDMRAVDGVGYMAKFGFTEKAIQQQGLLNMTFLMLPIESTLMTPAVNSFRSLVRGESRFPPPPTLGGKVAAMATNPYAIVKHLYRRYTARDTISTLECGGWSQVPNKAQMFGDRIDVINQIEQYPHRDNRVSLGESVDGFGQRRVRYEFSWREDDQARFVHSRHHFAKLARETGLGTYKFDPAAVPEIMSSHHPMGTTRMHEDPTQGVVDANCKVHGVDNLFVAGASVFPTGGYANPTLSAVAMGLRLAAFLAVVLPLLDVS